MKRLVWLAAALIAAGCGPAGPPLPVEGTWEAVSPGGDPLSASAIPGQKLEIRRDGSFVMTSTPKMEGTAANAGDEWRLTAKVVAGQSVEQLKADVASGKVQMAPGSPEPGAAMPFQLSKDGRLLSPSPGSRAANRMIWRRR